MMVVHTLIDLSGTYLWLTSLEAPWYPCLQKKRISLTIWRRIVMAKSRDTKKDAKKKAVKSIKEKKAAKRDKKQKKE